MNYDDIVTTSSDISDNDGPYKYTGIRIYCVYYICIPTRLFLLGKSRGVKHRWTPVEVQNLVDGVRKYGVGSWSQIYLNYSFLPCRDNVSLKDKWRNMIKSKEAPDEYL